MKFDGLRRNIYDNLIKGALVLLPLFLSIYFFSWLANLFDKTFSEILVQIGFSKDLPFGFGLLVGLVVLYVIGKTSDVFGAKHFNELLERMIKKIPVFGTIYRSLRDLTDYFEEAEGSAKGHAVIVTFEGFKIAGFLTRKDLATIPTQDSLTDMVAVYIPLAYMVGGGFTVFVHNSQVKDLDMPFDKAMQASLSAWMLKAEKDSEKA